MDVNLANAIKEAGAYHQHKGLGRDAREDEGNAACGGVCIDFFKGVQGCRIQD